MTDRAKKISELSTTSSVANTDKIVVLKDAANTSAASTRAMTVNNFAKSVAPLIREDIPGSNVSTANTSIPSNGTDPVVFLTIANTKMYEVFYVAYDGSLQNRSIGHIFVTANNTEVDAYNLASSSVGANRIMFDSPATINTTANTTTLYFSRQEPAAGNVIIKYQLTTYS